MQTTFPLSLICNVSVVEATAAVSGPTFNQGLVLGSKAAIPSYGTNPRVREYTSASSMLSDGFTTTDPEYIAATIYFSQTPTPEYLWIGRLDLTAIQTAIPHTGSAGTGYVVGDVITVVQTGASNGELKVATVGTGGVVETLSLVSSYQGTGYSVATGLTTTGGTGTGLEVDITAVGETPVQAIQYCRNVASTSWYTFMYPQGAKADHIALANWADSTDGQSYYVYATADADAIAGTTGNVFETLSAASVGRNFGSYTTTQSGVYLDNPYQAAAIMGQMMGLNTGEDDSAFSLYYKTLTDITTEPMPNGQTSLNTLTAENGNAYISIENSFKSLWPGNGGDGKTPDEQLFLDYLVSNIQYNVANAFAAAKKIPQTDSGQKIINTAAVNACASMVNIGFLAGGTWTGQTIKILGISDGSSLPNGYKVGSDLFKNQSAADRAAHKMMPIQIAIIGAGSGRSVSITINVQQ